MADVFISYSREDWATARGLYDQLTTQGYSVWWDDQLLASDDFYEAILNALGQASAAIVIWTKTSVKSKFVRDEARYAQHHKKLIAVRTSDVDIFEVPFGLGGQHTEFISEFGQICAALGALGVRPTLLRLPASSIAIKASKDVDQLVRLIAETTDAALKQEAINRLVELGADGRRKGAVENEKDRVTQIRTEVRSLTSGRFSAFWRGFFFRVPSFQFEKQGLWTSIGVTTSTLLISAGLALAPVLLQRLANVRDDDQIQGLVAPIGAIAMVIAAWLVIEHSTRFLESGNRLAGHLLRNVLLVIVAAFAYFVAQIVQTVLQVELWAVFLVLLVTFEAATLLRFNRSVRRALLGERSSAARGRDGPSKTQPPATPAPMPVVAPPRVPQKASGVTADLPPGTALVLSGFDSGGRPVRLKFPSGSSESGAVWTIGRSAERVDYLINDATISHIHASVRFGAQRRLEICDLGSTNGTFLDGRRIREEYVPLDGVSTVKFGGIDFEVSKA